MIEGRPIIASHSWLTSNLSIFLTTLLQEGIVAFETKKTSKFLSNVAGDSRFDALEDDWRGFTDSDEVGGVVEDVRYHLVVVFRFHDNRSKPGSYPN